MPGVATKLYKYLSPDRVDVIASGLIRYTQLGALNDPFEGKPNITGLSRNADARKSFQELLPSETKRAYEDLTPEIKAGLPFELFSTLVKARFSALEPYLPTMLNQMTPMVRKLLSEKMDEHIGILSLSEIPDNILMWSHYAANHTGFVLGFDAQHPYFDERKSENDDLRHLRRVLYRDSRPQVTMRELNGMLLFLVKSIYWAYEREWRILRPLADAETVQPTIPFAVHLFRYPPDAVTEIVLGAKILGSTKQSLVDAVRLNRDLAHVRLSQARIDEANFFLRIGDLES